MTLMNKSKLIFLLLMLGACEELDTVATLELDTDTDPPLVPCGTEGDVEGPDGLWDPTTGLCWQSYGYTIEPDFQSDMGAFDFMKQICSEVGANCPGWRLPTMGELLTIVRNCDLGDYQLQESSCYGAYPFIDDDFPYPNGPLSLVSSSTVVGDIDKIWILFMTESLVSIKQIDKKYLDYSVRVKCVKEMAEP